jgi:hypothetical protein
MRVKVITTACVLAGALSAMTASAHLLITVSCPDSGNSAAGISVTATQVNGSEVETGVTDSNGFLELSFINTGDFNVCVDPNTLPAGATLGTLCQVATVPLTPAANSVTFNLSGPFCTGAPSACWETGGGTLDKVKGDNVWTFGGVIYPGCSSKAAGGGNLNIVNHVTGLHFKGENFTVIDCRGVSTKSPKVTVNIIDWIGTGEVTLAGATIPVTFSGTFMDAKDGGAGNDGLYIQVLDGSGNLVFQIGSSSDISGLDILTTGNVQIHQSSCGKGKP